MPQGSLSARKKSAAKKRAYKKRLSLRLKRLGRAEMRIARAERAAEKRARAAERAAKRRLANQRAEEKKKFPQSGFQDHLARLYEDFRAAKQPHPDPRTNRSEKTRGSVKWNGGRRGPNKTNGKALLREALRDM